jgi:hypothetical protein
MTVNVCAFILQLFGTDANNSPPVYRTVLYVLSIEHFFKNNPLFKTLQLLQTSIHSSV